MSTTMRLTDDAIRLALTPAIDVHAPAGLADGIHSAIGATPQRRRSILGWAPSRRTRVVLRLAVVGLLVLALVGLLLLVGSKRRPASSPTTDTYHGGPERTGIMPGPAPSGDPGQEWDVTVNGSIGAWSPVVVDGVVYVADQSGSVTAIGETTGTELWQVNVGASINSGITVASGLLIVGDDAGMIHALDIKTGGDRWHFLASGAVHSAAAVVDGVAYIGTADGHFYALDVLNGAPRWPAPGMTAGSIGRAIAASGGLVYVGSGGATPSDPGTLQAYDAATGVRRWEQPLEPGNTSTPSVADGRVFVTGGLDATATGAHDLYVFDAATGTPSWPDPFRAPSGKTLLIGAVANGLVFAECTDGTMYVVDAATGREVWRADINSSLSPSAGVAGGTIYVTSDDKKIHAFDIASHLEFTGSWPIAVPGVPGSPVIVDGRIIVGTSFGEVVSITGTSSPPSGVSTP